MMKLTATIILCLAGFSMAAQAPVSKEPQGKKKSSKKAAAVKTYSISGNVSQTFSYCGGVAPSTDVMKENNTPKPFEGKTFYVRKGKVNSTTVKTVLSFTTDKNGNFSFQLPDGTYSIIQSQQLKALNVSDYTINENTSVDEKCLREWWSKPYYLLEVKGHHITGLSFVFHHPCFISGEVPCIQYTGPMPP